MPPPTEPAPAAPLAGVRVVEACQMVAGPLAGTLLADLGADVIKVEVPGGGDRLRYMGHRVDTIGALWAGVNRGKRTVTLDLQSDGGQALMRRLLDTADVFIQNFRPGVAERLGIDEERLRPTRPGLIYVSVSGFGATGPYAGEKSYDYVIQALSGMAALQADAAGEPVLVRNAVIDKVTANTAAQAVLAALLARSNGAPGQHIRVNMLDAALAFLWPDGMMQHAFLSDDVRPGRHIAQNYCVRATADGHITLATSSDRQFPGLCRALGTEQWLDDARFATQDAREDNADVLEAMVDAEVAKWRGVELRQALNDNDIPCALVVPLEQVPFDPQVVHNGRIVEHRRPHVGRVREVAPPVSFDRTPVALGRHAPAYDEHTDEVLSELGCSAGELITLRREGVIGPGAPRLRH